MGITLEDIKNLYLSFKGRISSQMYFVGIAALILIFLIILKTIPFTTPALLSVKFLIILAVFTIFSLMLTIKRLHDINMSGWFSLLFFVPILGGFFWIYMAFKQGDKGSNEFGETDDFEVSRGLFYLSIAFTICGSVYSAFVMEEKNQPPGSTKELKQFISQLPKPFRKTLKIESLVIVKIGKKTALGSFLTEDRIFIDYSMKDHIDKIGINQIKVITSDEKVLNVIKVISEDRNFHKIVLSVNKAVGIPSKLRKENRKKFEAMGAFN